MNTQPHPLPARRPALRGALSMALAALLLPAATGAFAQPQAAQPPAAAPAEAATPPGRTRAEVLAELQCARASGELEAAVLRSYSLPAAPRPSADVPCGPAGGQALTDAAPRTATR